MRITLLSYMRAIGERESSPQNLHTYYLPKTLAQKKITEGKQVEVSPLNITLHIWNKRYHNKHRMSFWSVMLPAVNLDSHRRALVACFVHCSMRPILPSIDATVHCSMRPILPQTYATAIVTHATLNSKYKNSVIGDPDTPLPPWHAAQLSCHHPQSSRVLTNLHVNTARHACRTR